jgi:hypothetical protein
MDKNAYYLYDNVKETEGTNYPGYVADALRSENPLAEIVTDGDALVGVMKVAIATGALVDIAKKGVIYGKEIQSDDVVAKIDAIYSELEQLEKALYRDNQEITKVPVNARLLHAALGAYGEEAEFMETLLNQIKNNGDLQMYGKGGALEEPGDGFWYGGLRIDELAKLCGVTVAEMVGVMLTMNIAKLRVRFPGKFSLEASENRNIAAEEATLQQKAA